MMLQIISIPADAFASGHLDLPAAGKLINLSPVKYPVVLRGIKPSPDNPMQFSFFMDVGDSNGIDDTSLKQEADRLIKYFLAALTIPEKDLWVNLSPYEKNRMIPPNLAQTAMGRDMLAQDYLLKQITASLIYPEGKYGKKFWDRVYEKARLSGYEQSLAAVSTFNKVWIVPQRAEVYVHQGIAYIHQAYLNVMLEKDYKALEKNGDVSHLLSDDTVEKVGDAPTFELAKLVKEIIIPELQREVNEGEHFAPLRQIFYSMVLAAWFKNNLKEAVINQWFADKSKVGVNINQPDIKTNEAIYERYLASYKKGAFNYIKEEVDSNGQMVLRKYFSGGEDFAMISGEALAIKNGLPPPLPSKSRARLPQYKRIDVNLNPVLHQVPKWPETGKGGVMVISSFDQMAISPMIGFLKQALAKAKKEDDRPWIPLFPSDVIEKARPAYAQKLYEWAIKAAKKFGLPLVLVSAKSLPQTTGELKNIKGELRKTFKLNIDMNVLPNQPVETDWVGLSLSRTKQQQSRGNVINEIGSWLWHQSGRDDKAMLVVNDSTAILSAVAKNQFGFEAIPDKIAYDNIIYQFRGLTFYEGKPLLRYESKPLMHSGQASGVIRFLFFSHWDMRGNNEIFASYDMDLGNGNIKGIYTLAGDDVTARQLAAASQLNHGRLTGATLQPTFSRVLIDKFIEDQIDGYFDGQGILDEERIKAYQQLGGGFSRYDFSAFRDFKPANPGDVFIYGVGHSVIYTAEDITRIFFDDDEMVYRFSLNDGRYVYITCRSWLNANLTDSDAAMQAKPSDTIENVNKGGIDFNPALMALTVSGEAIRLKALDPQLLNTLDASTLEGIHSTIIRIQSIENVFPN